MVLLVLESVKNILVLALLATSSGGENAHGSYTLRVLLIWVLVLDVVIVQPTAAYNRTLCIIRARRA